MTILDGGRTPGPASGLHLAAFSLCQLVLLPSCQSALFAPCQDALFASSHDTHFACSFFMLILSIGFVTLLSRISFSIAFSVVILCILFAVATPLSKIAVL